MVKEYEGDDEDVEMSVMSFDGKGTPQRKTISMSNKEQDYSFWQNKDWEKIESKPMLLFCVVTHEIRSSMTNE